ncbi:MAG: chloride channel protein [Rectinemataceae bacterium]|jgi:CIC family chloride channel protein
MMKMSKLTRAIGRIRPKQALLILSFVIGIVAGCSALVLKILVARIELLVTTIPWSLGVNPIYLVSPAIGILLTLFFIKAVVKDDLSHGVSRVLESIAVKNGDMPRHSVFSYIIACSLTAGLGGSVGMEAPILATGAGIGSNIGQLFSLNYKQKITLIGCGAAAAIGAIFKAPITGVVVALEILMLDITAASIIPVLISSATGALVSLLASHQALEFGFTVMQPFQPKNIPMYVILGLVCGFCSVYFTRTTYSIEGAMRKLSKWRRFAIGAILLGILILAFPPLYGEGYMAMRAILSGRLQDISIPSPLVGIVSSGWGLVAYLGAIVFLKAVATTLTTSSGGVGGIFAPSLFIGSFTGLAFSRALNLTGLLALPERNFSLVGMAGVLAGVMHAPLTGIFLIAEITGGYHLIIPLIITTAISYYTVGLFERYSIYTKDLAAQGRLITRRVDASVLTLMNVDELVDTSVDPILPDTSLGQIMESIARTRDRVIPVLGADSRFMGLVFMEDISLLGVEQSSLSRLQAIDVMRTATDSVDPKEPLQRVMDTFRIVRSSALPVIEGGRFVGLIHKEDIADAYRRSIQDLYDEE